MPETANPRLTRANCRYLLALIGALVPLAISCTNSKQSDQVTYQITSGSMAPTYWGPSNQAICQSCGRQWRVCAETASSSRPIECDICGGQVRLDSQLQPGDILKATKVGPSFSPARFDCIVFNKNTDVSVENPPTDSKSSSSAATWNCKRIWGLPGEELLLEQGELYVDGKMFRKSYEQFRRLSVPVSEFDSKASLGNLTDWQIVDANETISSKSFDRNRMVLRPGQTLQFYHASIHDPKTLSVYDDYSQNLSTPRNLKVVNDLAFDFEFELPSQQLGDNSIIIDFKLDYLKQSYQFQFQPTIKPLPSNSKEGSKHSFTIAAWDGVVVVVESKDQRRSAPTTRGDSTTGLNLLEPISESTASSDRTSLSVTCSNTCHIASARVFRDLFLRMDEREKSNHTENRVQVPSDQYFVIGDNLPISHDSRNGLGMVHRDQIQAILSIR